MKNKKIEIWLLYFAAIVPIVSIIFFAIGISIDYFSDKELYWKELLGDNQEILDKVNQFNLIDSLVYLFCRNFLTFTTIGNILCSTIILLKLLKKKDSYLLNVIYCVSIFWIVGIYNLGLFFKKIFNFKWYQWMSLICQHSIFLIIGFIIQIKTLFRQQYTNIKSINVYLIAQFMIVGYVLFFTFTGYLMWQFDAKPFFAGMSFTGYFPYPFLDIVPGVKPTIFFWLTPVSQYILAFIAFLITNQLLLFSLVISTKKRSEV
ncbi:hypothetical protein [Spiroplasma culicicola]|uniref:Transmembrane protein n=1 Tax=Spiroplasma culicicola AES-1 TaxID=1276246 RepID=W6A859_9MOLU|nr:hypothetical protein [Spiroplasma culicicola]AHI53328.1 hypothetical protein SCULI_v1c09880 [Spiroplasma culicicola AES-1]